MKLWRKLLITLAAMLIAGFVADRPWMMTFEMPIPGHLAGMVGGLTAVPVWEPQRWLTGNRRIRVG